MSRTIGLTIGKYAPLHAGHQRVIETALAEMDEVLAVIYDSPEVIDVPLQVRAGWLRELYPRLRVLEAWDGPSDFGDTPAIKHKQERYILKLLNGQTITHFYSSEFYGDHMSRALHAVNRLVDPQRQVVPVSGTAIRANTYALRNYVHPRVYRDLVTNIVLLGAPSTGKTTLAARLADEYHTAWMPEYGREYWDAHQVNHRLSLEQLVDLAEGHLQREEQALGAADTYLFSDTNALTTRLFSLYYHGRALPRLEELAGLAAARYDLVLVCDTDIPYEDSIDRSGDANRQVFQKQVLADLADRRIPYIWVRGSLEERVRQVRAVLARFRKYQNYFGVEARSHAGLL
jgi:NadR type nicotinamide-nucleotide adenylyltransferase